MEEIKNEVNQKVVETKEDSYKSGAVQYIDSREVAEMVGKEHRKLLRDIRTYIDQIKKINEGQNPKSKIGLSDSEVKRKIAFSDFFIESSYSVEGQSRSYPCYLVTRKGCEFIAHKLTGIKGTAFTATYINRFHEMENQLAEGEYEKRFQQLMERQGKFEQMVLAKLNQIESHAENAKDPEYIKFPTIEEDEDGLTRRRRELNRLVNKLVRVSGWDKNFALHMLYKTLEEVLGIYLDDYMDIYKEETCRSYASTIEVVTAYDRLYETAVNLCKNTINNMA